MENTAIVRAQAVSGSEQPHRYPNRLDENHRLQSSSCCCGCSSDFILLLADAWRVVKTRPYHFIGTALLTLWLSFCVTLICGGLVAAGMITLPFTASMMHAAMQVSRGGDARHTVLTGRWTANFVKPGLKLRIFWTYILTNLPYFIMGVVSLVVWLSTPHKHQDDDHKDDDEEEDSKFRCARTLVVILLCVWHLLTVFALPLSIDRPHLRPMHALCLSIGAASRNWCTLFGFMFYVPILLMAGFVLLFVGIIPAAAILIVSVSLMYAELFGLYAVAQGSEVQQPSVVVPSVAEPVDPEVSKV